MALHTAGEKANIKKAKDRAKKLRDKAKELDLAGYAKNLENGTVEVVAQGKEETINQLIDYIKSNPGISKVEDMKIQHKDPEIFDDFEIY